MKIFHKILPFIFTFSLGCAPITSTTPLFSSSHLQTASESNNTLTPGLQNQSLKLLFDSITCDNFEDRMWNHIYITLFKKLPPPSPDLIYSKIKPYSKKYILEKGGTPKNIRDFSNNVTNIYTIALEFFSNKSKDKILDDLYEIETLRIENNQDQIEISSQVTVFLEDIQKIFNDLRQLAYSLNLECLTKDLPIQYNITFHKKMNMFEMANLLHKRKIFPKKTFLKYCTNKDLVFALLDENLESVEGYLYPGTYQVSKNSNPAYLIQDMVYRFLEVYENMETSINPPLSRHQAVILASMIEKEVVLDSEKPHISDVFHKRLEINMKLQSDPTVPYGILRKTGKIPKTISKTHIKQKTNYNTYHFTGFPLGPITNPDYHSLNAALNPADNPFYYFVGDGTKHFFAETYEDHKRNISKIK